MMSDPRLSTLFRWGVENSAVATSTDGSEQTSPKQQLDPQMLAALLSGPSDADLMQEAIKAVHSSDFDIDQKIIALTNFRDLIEGIDNANNVDKLKLWSPLLELLKSEERRIRLMAASCVSSAVQNNEKCQKELHSRGGITTLAEMALKEDDEPVRLKAITAISSAVRNHQAGLGVITHHFPETTQTLGTIDATDMAAVDALVDLLRNLQKKP